MLDSTSWIWYNPWINITCTQYPNTTTIWSGPQKISLRFFFFQVKDEIQWMNVCVLWLKTLQALGKRRVSFAIQLKVHWNYNAKTMYTAWSLVCIELLEGFRQVLNPNPRHLGTWTSRYWLGHLGTRYWTVRALDETIFLTDHNCLVLVNCQYFCTSSSLWL